MRSLLILLLAVMLTGVGHAQPVTIIPHSDRSASIDLRGSQAIGIQPGGALTGVKVLPNDGATIARDLSDRFADTVSPKDFGAVCNGAADDTAALQAMATKISTQTIPVTVQLPVGICTSSQTITIHTGAGSFFTIKGYGQDTSTIAFTAKVDGLIICEPGAIAAACNGGTAATPVKNPSVVLQRVELSGFTMFLNIGPDATPEVVADPTSSNFNNCTSGDACRRYAPGSRTFKVNSNIGIVAGQVAEQVPGNGRCATIYDMQVTAVTGNVVTFDTPFPNYVTPGCKFVFFNPEIGPSGARTLTTAIAIHGTTLMQEGPWSPQTKIEKVAIYGAYEPYPGGDWGGFPTQMNPKVSWGNGIVLDTVSNTNMNDVLVSGTPARGNCFTLLGQDIDPYNVNAQGQPVGHMLADDHHWHDIRCYSAQYGFSTNYNAFIEGVFISDASFVGVKEGIFWKASQMYTDQFTMTNFTIDSDFDAIDIYNVQASQISNGYIIHGSRSTNYYALNSNPTTNTVPMESDVIAIGNSFGSTVSAISVLDSAATQPGVLRVCGVAVGTGSAAWVSGVSVSQLSLGESGTSTSAPVYGGCFQGSGNVQFANSSIYGLFGATVPLHLTGWPQAGGGFVSGSEVGRGASTTGLTSHQCANNSVGGIQMKDNPNVLAPPNAAGLGCYN